MLDSLQPFPGVRLGASLQARTWGWFCRWLCRQCLSKIHVVCWPRGWLWLFCLICFFDDLNDQLYSYVFLCCVIGVLLFLHSIICLQVSLHSISFPLFLICMLYLYFYFPYTWKSTLGFQVDSWHSYTMERSWWSAWIPHGNEHGRFAWFVDVETAPLNVERLLFFI